MQFFFIMNILAKKNVQKVNRMIDLTFDYTSGTVRRLWIC
jgi:hypothetical protein